MVHHGSYQFENALAIEELDFIELHNYFILVGPARVEQIYYECYSIDHRLIIIRHAGVGLGTGSKHPKETVRRFADLKHVEFGISVL